MSNKVVAEVKKRIQQTQKANQEGELDLSEIQIEKFVPQIASLIEKCKKVEVLHLVGCGLKSLAGFPKGNFVALDLSRNELSDDSNFDELLKFPNLTQIILTENKVEKLETVLSLSRLTKLVEIDFEGNPVTSAEGYPKQVFEKFEVIQYVDRKDKDGNIQVDEEEGDFSDDDDEGEDEYDAEDDEFEDDDEDFDEEEEESEEKPKKGGRKKK